jgi:alpha-galactosidase
MMALWAIFRSPLIRGCVLTDLDEWTLSLIRNREYRAVFNLSGEAADFTAR